MVWNADSSVVPELDVVLTGNTAVLPANKASPSMWDVCAWDVRRRIVDPYVLEEPSLRLLERSDPGFA
jgi:hypothetical protein